MSGPAGGVVVKELDFQGSNCGLSPKGLMLGVGAQNSERMLDTGLWHGHPPLE